MSRIEKKRVYAFIDSQNLNLGIKNQGWILDYRKFRLYLKEKYNVSKAFIFIGKLIGNDSLYRYLQNSGFTLVFKPVQIQKRKGVHIIKGNVDAELVLHTMIHLDRFHKAIIVSGDGDFRCLIEYLEKKDKLLKVMVPSSRYSSLLKQFNMHNYIVRIDLLRKSLGDTKKTGIRGRSKP